VPALKLQVEIAYVTSDRAALFEYLYDATQGADGPLSGLIAMLTALHALHSSATNTSSSSSSNSGFSSYSKRIVLLALAGEPWNYMGSRRLLFEAASGSNNTAGFNMSLVEQVSVGSWVFQKERNRVVI
jgi:nicastrin